MGELRSVAAEVTGPLASLFERLRLAKTTSRVKVMKKSRRLEMVQENPGCSMYLGALSRDMNWLFCEV